MAVWFQSKWEQQHSTDESCTIYQKHKENGLQDDQGGLDGALYKLRPTGKYNSADILM